ncbi:MAG TPA: EAL domain-containing protein [Gammaproteobacteria bacterium]
MTWNKRNDVEILIVEDSTTQAEQLAAILEHHGYAPAVAPDGEQALDMLRRRPPALVISDVVMPKLDGYGLCSAIKGDDDIKHVPVILVTTLSDPNDVLRGLECGADNFIRKPIDEHYLLSRIDYLLMNRALRKHQKTQMGMEIDLRGQRHFINSDRQQILDLLISTYEQAVDLNKELTQRERELARSNEVLDSLFRIADELNGTVGEREVVERVLDRVMELPDVHAGWIATGDENGQPRIMAVRNLALNVDYESLVEMDEDALGVQCHARVPFRLPQSGKAGAMSVVSFNEDGFDEGQMQLLNSIGNQLAIALERAEMYEHLEQMVADRTALLTAEMEERKRQEAHVARLNRLYSVLSGINTTIVRVRTREELFAQVCRIAVEQGQFALAWIAKVDPGTKRVIYMRGAAGGGNEVEYEDLDKASADLWRCEVISGVLQTGEFAVCNTITSEQRTLTHWIGETPDDCRALIALPLFRDEECVGVLALYTSIPDVFDEEEMRLLTEIAGDIGFALGYQEKEQRLHYLAYFDSITGLPNRSLFADRLNQAVFEAERHKRTVGVAMLDLDRFKTINDSLGHTVGDAFLKAVADRLQESVREGDTVARIAGDEFGFVLADMRHEEDASYVANKILGSFAAPFTAAGHELFAGASLGIAVFPSDGSRSDELIRNADAAMYRAKESGRNGYQFYSPEMTLKARDRLALENALRHALKKEEFLLHYQPVVDLATDRIIGVEALVRWQNAERGLVSPLDFIPIAEDTSLIVDLGAWVLEEACRQATSGWPDARPDLRLAINVSTRQFLQGDLRAQVESALERTGMDPKRLTLEITESRLMQNVEEMVAVMRALGELGVRFSIDDFGTGYSSLAYLKNLPIANLKIDRSFVMNVPDNADDSTIVRTIVTMAHSLNQRVIAEGVETAQQLEFLRTLGCDAVQGYYFSKPLPAGELHALLGKGVFE